MLRFVLFIAVLLGAPNSWAQDSEKKQEYQPYKGAKPSASVHRDFVSGPRYANLAWQLMNEKPENFEYNSFRAHYSKTRHYDPLGDETRDKLLYLAYVVQTTEDQGGIDKALQEYEALLTAHLAHYGVVIQAISLAKQDKRFGDLNLLSKVKNGLLKRVINSGPGRTLNSAYEVITMAEEKALLSHLNVEVMHTQSNKEGIVHYNMHAVVDRETQRPYTVFVNISRPMYRLESLRKMREDQTFSIRR